MSNYEGVYIPESQNNTWNKAFAFIEPNTKVLDVGCSTGAFGVALMKYKNCTVDGVEPDKGDSSIASKKLHKVYNGFLEDAIKQKFIKEKYDHIVFLDVIEHLYEPVTLLNKLKKYIKPGGSIVFSIPNMAHISTRIMLLAGDFEYGETGLLDKTHLHFYTGDEIERIFNEAGLEIDKLDFTEETYSRGQIKSELGKIGILNPTKDLIDVLSTDSGRIFQYIGAAKFTKNNIKPKKRKQYSPDPQGLINRYHEGIENNLKEDIAQKNEQIVLLEQDIKRKNMILNDPYELSSRIRLSVYIKNYIIRKIR